MSFHDIIDFTKPIVIAGPTASGKSALALDLARAHGGAILNADALQVYARWRILSARPSGHETAAVPHHLYGHVASKTAYSVGAWLRDLAAVMARLDGQLPIIVGGTGLYLSALVDGLADIPPVPAMVRTRAETMLEGKDGLAEMLAQLHRNDMTTWGKIDRNNPARVQRAWEVLEATGHGLASWQQKTAPPLLARGRINALLLEAPKAWLTPRIETRFRQMVQNGALDEVRAALPDWNPALPSSKAIGAPELIAHLRGEIDLETAITRAAIATRQYAKRQRSWFRARMGDWTHIDLSTGKCE